MTATILCVDDETELRQLIAMELADVGYTVIEAGNGREALAKMADTTPDLILSDVTMPEMNGYELLAAVREAWPDLPVILLSALVEQRMEQGVEQGADRRAANAYLTKPVDFDALLEQVARHLRRPAAPCPAAQ